MLATQRESLPSERKGADNPSGHRLSYIGQRRGPWRAIPSSASFRLFFAADVVGYSRLMNSDEVGTLAALKAHRRVLVDPAIAAHHGRIVKTTGDGALVEFASVVDAVRCAIVIQRSMVGRNVNIAEDKRIRTFSSAPDGQRFRSFVRERPDRLSAQGSHPSSCWLRRIPRLKGVGRIPAYPHFRQGRW